MTRGELAKKTGCNIETIRYYERIGLLPTPNRSPSGYRVYSDADVSRLCFIQRSKDLGFGTARIREFLSLSDHPDQHTRAEVKALTETHIEEIKQKVDDLNRIREQLIAISSHCDGSSRSAEACPILLSLFESDLISDT